MKKILVITYSCDGTAKARMSRIHVHAPKCPKCGEPVVDIIYGTGDNILRCPPYLGMCF